MPKIRKRNKKFKHHKGHKNKMKPKAKETKTERRERIHDKDVKRRITAEEEASHIRHGFKTRKRADTTKAYFLRDKYLSKKHNQNARNWNSAVKKYNNSKKS
jgi:hypothetical protein